jgi:hypothetical protein
MDLAWMPEPPGQGHSDCQIEEANQNITEEYSARDIVGLGCCGDSETVLLWIPPNERAANEHYRQVENQTLDQESTHVREPP